jgi:tRNA (cmo5U34)-methyltransferase
MSGVTKSYDAQAQAYDDFIRKLVPDYSLFHDLMVKFLPKPTTVLDIGCGTGNTSMSLMENNPSLHLTCLDTSSKMLEIAKEKLGDQHHFIEASIEDYETADTFDAVLSVMVMHNIQMQHDRLKVYKKISRILNGGGVYLTVDIFKGENSRLHNTYMDLWREFMLGGLPENEVDEKWLKLHKEKDKPLKLTEQIQLLKEAGFSTVDVVHKRLQFAMIIAQ